MRDEIHLCNGFSMQLSPDPPRAGSRRAGPRALALSALGAILLHAALVTALLLMARAPMMAVPEAIDVSLVVQPFAGNPALPSPAPAIAPTPDLPPAVTPSP